ncbi:hypothetical protein RRG08_046622 [Elysia crispata]|uniref:Uncharacterized protein n=1 Tax=Elysia crispata TaxID=231223 RepID=A0AAE1APR4_9GAST|nr:hypothetical protein RRG08_046622 [Elysia crispata]
MVFNKSDLQQKSFVQAVLVEVFCIHPYEERKCTGEVQRFKGEFLPTQISTATNSYKEFFSPDKHSLGAVSSVTPNGEFCSTLNSHSHSSSLIRRPQLDMVCAYLSSTRVCTPFPSVRRRSVNQFLGHQLCTHQGITEITV